MCRPREHLVHSVGHEDRNRASVQRHTQKKQQPTTKTTVKQQCVYFFSFVYESNYWNVISLCSFTPSASIVSVAFSLQQIIVFPSNVELILCYKHCDRLGRYCPPLCARHFTSTNVKQRSAFSARAKQFPQTAGEWTVTESSPAAHTLSNCPGLMHHASIFWGDAPDCLKKKKKCSRRSTLNLYWLGRQIFSVTWRRPWCLSSELLMCYRRAAD